MVLMAVTIAVTGLARSRASTSSVFCTAARAAALNALGAPPAIVVAASKEDDALVAENTADEPSALGFKPVAAAIAVPEKATVLAVDA